MGKFVFGLVVGTGLGVALLGQAMAEIWKGERWHDFAFGVDQSLAEKYDRPKQLVDLTDLPRIPSPR